MSRCTDCKFDWQLRRDDVVPYAKARVCQFRDLFSPALAVPARAEALGVRPSADVWSPLEYLAHMRDIAEFFANRINRVLTEDRPTLHVQHRFAELAELRSYRSEDPAVVLTQFEEQASELQAVLEHLDETHWARVGIGSSGDERTVLMLARRFAHETHHHLLDISHQLATGGSFGARISRWHKT